MAELETKDKLVNLEDLKMALDYYNAQKVTEADLTRLDTELKEYVDQAIGGALNDSY